MMQACYTGRPLRLYASLFSLGCLIVLLFGLLFGLLFAFLIPQTAAANLPDSGARALLVAPAALSPNVCDDYIPESGQGSISPGTADVGNHCDDCESQIHLPFEFTLYDRTATSVSVGSNGVLTLLQGDPPANACLPAAGIGYAILPYWDNLRTDCQGCGIFTDTRGTAPSRIFDIEWRTAYASNQGTANFEIELQEASRVFNVIYGNTTEAGSGATIGVQWSASACWTQYQCNTGGVFPGLKTIYRPRSLIPTATATPSPTNTLPPTATVTPGGPSPTPTSCTISFSDVHSTDYFYTPVQYLYCHGVISGYADNTFRPYNNTTRSQMVKADVLGFAVPIATPAAGAYTFEDVPPSHPFFAYVETAAAHGIVSGYNCGGPGEPCDTNNRPYFRPYANVTRGQLAKIDVSTAGWPLSNPATGRFEDVLPFTAFYQYVETAACRGIVSGYNCGGPGEPCDPQSRPYFHPNNDAIRGQIAKIVYLSISGPTACSATPEPAP